MSLPRVVRHDCTALAPALCAAAERHGVPYEVLLAVAGAGSDWRCQAYRYEPTFDRRYVSRRFAGPEELQAPAQRWAEHVVWVRDGPSATIWFTLHPERREEWTPHDWSFVAQTRLAARYGALQGLAVTAYLAGFKGMPEDLYTIAGLEWPVRDLAARYRHARRWQQHAWPVALARFWGGAHGNDHPERLRHRAWADRVNHYYTLCWGTPLY